MCALPQYSGSKGHSQKRCQNLSNTNTNRWSEWVICLMWLLLPSWWYVFVNFVRTSITIWVLLVKLSYNLQVVLFVCHWYQFEHAHGDMKVTKKKTSPVWQYCTLSLSLSISHTHTQTLSPPSLRSTLSSKLCVHNYLCNINYK